MILDRVLSGLACLTLASASSRQLLQGVGVGTGAAGTYNFPAGSANSLVGPPPSGPAPSAPFCNCTDNSVNSTVCGADAQTYGNPCIAKCANVLVLHSGPCNTCSDPATGTAGSCQCATAGYNPVCADGITWASPCDALCTGRPCYSPGVCQYNAAMATFTPTTGGTNAAGGVAAAANNPVKPSPGSASRNYADALHKALLFYEIQRSGALPASRRLAWRGDSCLDCKGPGGEDMSGGYYEAGGSYLKLGLPSAYTVTVLAYSIYTFPDGYSKVDELATALEALKWGSDLLVAATPNAQNFVAVVGNDTQDFDTYAPPELYTEVNPGPRPSVYINQANPGSEIAGEAAAALAATAAVFRASGGAQYAGEVASLISTAEELYQLALSMDASYKGTTNPVLAIHDRLYPSTGFLDELAWAAAWLYVATNQASYLSDAGKYYAQWYQTVNYPGIALTYGEKGPALHVLLAQLNPTNPVYNTNARAFFDQYLTGAVGGGSSVPHTPGGLAYPFHYGALRPAMATAFLGLVFANQTTDAAYSGRLFNYAAYQVNYALGDSGRSWVVGVGQNYPTYLWHKWSYNSVIDFPLRDQYQVLGPATGPWTVNKTARPVVVMAAKFQMEGSYEPQRFICYGALFGAPLQDDSLVFGRKDYSYAEPTTEGQGGLTGALAGLVSYFSGQTAVNDCGLDLGWSNPNASAIPGGVNNLQACSGAAAAGK